MKKISLDKLNSVGQSVKIKLSRIGITNLNDLRAIGACRAYKFMSKFFPNEHLNVTNYLYELECALKNKSSTELSEEDKRQLRMEAGLT